VTKHLSAAAAAFALLFVTACGGDDGTTPTGPAETTAAAPETTAAAAETTAAATETTAAATETTEVAPETTAAAPTETTQAETTETTQAESTETTQAGDDESALPLWQTAAITDVDGQTFTLQDFEGTPVFVETFATWCPNCRSQLRNTNTAAEAAGDGAVFIALSTETDIDPADVKAYAEDNGFTSVRFAVMSPEVLASLVDCYGQTIANPPSTPKFVINADGVPGEMSTGAESADEITSQLAI
jgi:thiol-disulfide isomerase/thioredoxin